MEPAVRRSIYGLMLLVTVATTVARIANVEFLIEPSLYKAYPLRKWPTEKPSPWPSFSSNDRSRWATVRSLVEEGTFVIGQRVELPDGKYRDEGILFEDGFKSVDAVLDPEKKVFFSTKPPLLTMAVAGEYWLLHRYLNWNIAEHRWEVVVVILLTFNVLPLAIGLWLLALLIEHYGQSDWGKLFTFACACFGTFLTTFSITLNNHVPAACGVMIALYAVLRGTGPFSMIVAGLAAGWAMCLDLPSAAFAGAISAVIFMYSPKRLLLYLPALAIPLAAQEVINYKAYGMWEPLYSKFGTEWYEYTNSHWSKRNPGIDFLNEPKPFYAMNLLVGHHGLFSLTPIWLFSLLGIIWLPSERTPLRATMMWFPVILLVVLAFYIVKTNNYGGWTSGPRWLFWLTPLLLIQMIPPADRLGRSKAGRWLAYLFLGASVFAATYPWTNPWRHPWIHQWCEYMGWIKY
jgi:hypothetical protein